MGTPLFCGSTRKYLKRYAEGLTCGRRERHRSPPSHDSCRNMFGDRCNGARWVYSEASWNDGTVSHIESGIAKHVTTLINHAGSGRIRHVTSPQGVWRNQIAE